MDSDPLTAEDCREIAETLSWQAIRTGTHEGSDARVRLRLLAQKINDLGVRLHANPAYLTEKDSLYTAQEAA